MSRLFFEDAVRPILDDSFSDLKYAAALIGSGSEVLGFDDEMSVDHHWGPRLMLFLNEEDKDRLFDKIDKAMRQRLPLEFHGYPTNFTPPDSEDNGTQLLKRIKTGEVNHRVEIFTSNGYIKSYLGFDITGKIESADWLSFPQHKLRAIIEGEVYHDEIDLRQIRRRFDYYPHDIWLYLLASGWRRLAQDEHLMGRAGCLGDEIGSSIIASRLIRDIMKLCFLMEKKYVPYSKWLGVAFKLLLCSAEFIPLLSNTISADGWRAREEFFSEAYEKLAVKHNELKITDSLTTGVTPFFGRPFKVIRADRFADAIVGAIENSEIKIIAEKGLIGGIDFYSDSTDILSDAKWRETLRRLYQ